MANANENMQLDRFTKKSYAKFLFPLLSKERARERFREDSPLNPLLKY
jgi:hypothetical protein